MEGCQHIWELRVSVSSAQNCGSNAPSPITPLNFVPFGVKRSVFFLHLYKGRGTSILFLQRRLERVSYVMEILSGSGKFALGDLQWY